MRKTDRAEHGHVKPVRAVISAGGLGTRFFPIAKVLNKAMLPILNRPVLDYIIDDCIIGGAIDIAIVCQVGDTQVRAYLSEDEALRDHLIGRGLRARYRLIEELHTRGTFHFISQPLVGPYGTAVPAMLAEQFVRSDDLYLTAGDDIVLRRPGDSILTDLRALKAATGAEGVIAATRVPATRLSRYGVLSILRSDGVVWLQGILEKPSAAEAPSDMINIGRILVDHTFIDYVRRLSPDPINGEYVSVAALNEFARYHRVAVYVIDSGYYDCGEVDGWLSANLAARAIVSRKSMPDSLQRRCPC